MNRTALPEKTKDSVTNKLRNGENGLVSVTNKLMEAVVTILMAAVIVFIFVKIVFF